MSMSISLQASIICKHSIPQSNPLLLSPQFHFPRRSIGGSAKSSSPLRSRFLRHRALNSQDLTELTSGSNSGEAGGDVKNERRLPIVVFLVGVFARLREGFEKLLYSDWFSWWPFWRLEKRLERLIAEADSNPKDAAKQSALLVELNKHSPEAVIQRFEQRAHAVDSTGVAEYLRALVSTDAIAEYLPDEQSGKPSSLPFLLQELKQRASENEDEPFANPGVSDKQPLHVMVVRQKETFQKCRDQLLES